MRRFTAAVLVFLSVTGTLSCAAPRAAYEPQDPGGPVAQAAAASSGEYGSGTVLVGDFEDDAMLAAWRGFLARVRAGDKTITFQINSFGGSVFGGMELIQAIEVVKKTTGVQTICVVDSKAYSMGAAFLESGACDVRLMTKRSTLLFHNGSTAAEGTVEVLRETAELMAGLNDALAEICAGRMLITTEQYQERIAKGAWTMSWREALAVGAIDGTVDASDLPAPYP